MVKKIKLYLYTEALSRLTKEIIYRLFKIECTHHPFS